jgi:hypothetical protein
MLSQPTRGTFAGCCAWAEGRVMSKTVSSTEIKMFLIMRFPPVLLLLIAYSSDNSICSHQHIRRNRQADLLRRFQIDDELKLDRLLDG